MKNKDCRALITCHGYSSGLQHFPPCTITLFTISPLPSCKPCLVYLHPSPVTSGYHSFILWEGHGYPVVTGVQCREFLLHLKLNMLTGIIPRNDEITLPTTALSETADGVSTTKILWKCVVLREGTTFINESVHFGW